VLSARAAASGVPWLSSFEPAILAAHLKRLGFAEAVNFAPEEARTRYLAGRTDGLVTPRLSHLMKARVGAVPEAR